MAGGEESDTVYPDFSKPLDRIPFEILTTKAKAHGAVGDVCRWIKEWLKDRKPRLWINGEKLDSQLVTSEVPQVGIRSTVIYHIIFK